VLSVWVVFLCVRHVPGVCSIAMHDERKNKHANDEAIPAGAVPTYLLDREGVNHAKVLSNTIKQKRKEKAGKWDVPIPKVKPISDDEMFKVMQSGKRQSTWWPTVVVGWVGWVGWGWLGWLSCRFVSGGFYACCGACVEYVRMYRSLHHSLTCSLGPRSACIVVPALQRSLGSAW
jgi:hypothetical protein